MVFNQIEFNYETFNFDVQQSTDASELDISL